MATNLKRQLLTQVLGTRIDSGTNIGTFPVGQFARINGLFSTISSLTLAYRMGADSGNFIVTSSVVINSGASVFDVINYGRVVNFQVTAGTSQAPTFFLQGESVR